MIKIDVSLVRDLIDAQFPQWSHLPITPVAFSGWDNRTFHLGTKMSVRLPSAEAYALQVDKEQQWLPNLAPHLPLDIPQPIAKGRPTSDYPWQWSIYPWIEGQAASVACIRDKCLFAKDLAHFLQKLQRIDPRDGPLAGEHSFFRGGSLGTYHAEVEEALKILSKNQDVSLLTSIWSTALKEAWKKTPVWIHGDVATGNLLVREGRLCAVIDFGQLAVGDPACDLVITWTFFAGESRDAFRQALQMDNATWARARGWALWKALIVCAQLPGTNPLEIEKSWNVLKEISADFKMENNLN